MGETVSKRNGTIDLWKFAFSVMIVLFHSFYLTNEKGTIFAGGALAVEFFFLVSGYLMVASASRYERQEGPIGQKTRDFLFRKIRGLYPELVIAWGIGFVVMHAAKDGFKVTKVIKHLLTGVWELLLVRQSGMGGYSVNGVTWYISAMLLAMLILFPLLLKNRDLFLNVLAPAITIFLLGYLWKWDGNLHGPNEWVGFAQKGFLRALAELSLGCICWSVSQKIQQYEYTRLARWLFTLLELAGYLGSVFWCWGHTDSNVDFTVLLMLAVSVTLSFSKTSMLCSVFDRPLFYWLGKVSLMLYLSHGYWCHTIDLIFPGESYGALTIKYLIASGLTTVVIYVSSTLYRKYGPVLWEKCRKKLIKNEKNH